jgi:hypothetical protein
MSAARDTYLYPGVLCKENGLTEATCLFGNTNKSEAILTGADVHRGGSRGRFCFWTRMSGAVLFMEADFGGGFHYGGEFVLHGGGLSFLIYVNYVLLCRRS